MNKICGYSCEHNKSGVCQISVCDKKSIISDKTEVQTLRLDKLDYTIIPNSDIKPLLDRSQQENKQLKDNWNKLREYFNERIEVCDNRLSSPFCNFEKATKERLIFTQCLEKLEELEQGSDE